METKKFEEFKAVDWRVHLCNILNEKGYEAKYSNDVMTVIFNGSVFVISLIDNKSCYITTPENFVNLYLLNFKCVISFCLIKGKLGVVTDVLPNLNKNE